MATIDNSSVDALVVDNRYVGKTVGNILDQYDSPVYNLKLYLKNNLNPRYNPQEPETNSNESDEATVSQTPPSETAGDPDEMIVLAQTGVTAATIDNLQIQHMQGNQVTPMRVTFTITEPGGVTFIDQMIAAKKKLGLGISESVMFLDILFRGYRSDIEDNEANGEPAIIAGPFTYRITHIKYGLSVTESGSVYEFSATIAEEIASTDENYRIPVEIETVGTTVSQHIAMYVSKLNSAVVEKSKDFTSPDEYVIDVSALLQGNGAEGVNAEYVINDMIVTPDLASVESINRVLNNDSDEIYDVSTEYTERQNDKFVGPSQDIPNAVKLVMKIGSTIEDFIATLLSMNDDFFQRATRIINPGDPTTFEVDSSKTFVHWFTIASDVEYLTYDPKRRGYTKRFYYKPIIYKEGRTDIGAIRQEFNELTREEVNRRLLDLNIFKAYEYFFTGRNDQILSFDFNIDEAYILETSLADWGNFSAAAAIPQASSTQPSENTSNGVQGLAQLASQAKTKDAITNSLDFLRREASSQFESLVSNFGSLTGLSDNQVREIVRSGDSEAARGLVNALSNKQVSTALAELELRQRTFANQVGVLTESDDPSITTSQGGLDTYNPQTSGVVYSSELIEGLEQSLEGIDADDAIESVQTSIADEELFACTMKPVESTHQLDNATFERGTTRPSFFTHLLNQHGAAAKSLFNLEFEIRGDPWWLGNKTISSPTELAGSDTTETDETGVIYGKGTNNILFTVAAPKRFDFDVTDEDGPTNSGLYQTGGLNNMLSGVYTVLRSTSTFTGGVFTQNLTAIKHFMLPPEKFDDNSEQTDE